MKKTLVIIAFILLQNILLTAQSIFNMSFDNETIGAYTDAIIKSKYSSVGWSQTNGRAYITEDAQRGKVLTVNYPKSVYGPTNSGVQFLASLTPATTYYLDYFVKFNAGFDFKLGGKLPGLTSGGSEFTGGVQPTDGKGWSARYMWTDATPDLYLYYIDQPTQYGEATSITNSQFSTNIWHRLTQQIIVNDANTNNAIIRVWVDGHLTLEKKNFRLRIAPDGLIDSFYFSTFFGGDDASWAPSVDCSAAFDDINVSTSAPDYLKEINQTEKINLNPTTTSRLATTNKQWGTNFGDVSVCLWKDDKVAAFSITIDDNIESETDFWKGKQASYGFPFTWFLITEAGSWPGFDTDATADRFNVKDWTKYAELAKLGNFIDCHDDRNWYKTVGSTPNPDSLKYVTRLKATRQKVASETGSFGNKPLTYAYPFGEGNVNWARTQYIAIRGTTGVLNFADKVNYLDVNSASSPGISAAPATYIDPLLNKVSTLFNVNYYRGWGSTHFHGLYTDDAKTKADNLLQYLFARKDSMWVSGFSAIAQYGQSRDTHHLTVNSINTTEIKFTLTDEMSDALFFYPLTVKIKVGNDWANVTAVQNGVSVSARLISYNGNKYALIDAVPDRGQVTVTAEVDSDPAVITVAENTSVEANTSKTINFGATTTKNEAITFTFSQLPAFISSVIDNSNNGHFVVSPNESHIGAYTITLNADNGRSTISKNIGITVTPDMNTIIVKANVADAAVYFPLHTFVDTNNRDNVIAGGGYTSGKQMSAVFPFQIPPMPEGKKLKSASFQAYLESFNTPTSITGHIDLYTLEPRTSSAVLLSDCYAGDFLSTNGTAIQENFSTKDTPVGVVKMNTSGEESLTQILKTAYTNAHAGKYIFVRLSNSDVNQNMYGRTIFTTADGAAKTAIDSRFPSLVLKYEGTASEIQHLSQSSDFSAFPNPLKSSVLNIKVPQSMQYEIMNIEIWDMKGTLHYTTQLKTQTEIQLNLPELNAQIYLLKCKTKNNIFQSQLIKI